MVLNKLNKLNKPPLGARKYCALRVPAPEPVCFTDALKMDSASYLPVSELSSFSSHEIRAIWKVISCPLEAN
jgi:hypothetical protein